MRMGPSPGHQGGPDLTASTPKTIPIHVPCSMPKGGFQEASVEPSKPVESKTRTYHGQVGSGRPAERPGGVGQDGVPTELFAQETKVHRTFQLFLTNKRNPM